MNIFKLMTVCVCLAAGFIACSDETEAEATIHPAKHLLVFSQTGGVEEVEVTSTTDWRVSTPAEATLWCKATRLAGILRVSIDENTDSDVRKITLELYSDGIRVPVQVEQLGTDPAIRLDKSALNIAASVLEETVSIASNIEYEVRPDDSWITVKPVLKTKGVMASREVVFRFERNATGKKRTGTVTFVPVKEEHKKLAVTLQVIQNFASAGADDISDRRIEIVKATANQQEANQTWGKQDIMASCDGDVSTFYHSPWNSGRTAFPVVLTYNLKEESDLDYLIYTPRQDSDNGAWGKTKIAFAYNGGNEFVEELDTDFAQLPRTARRLDLGKTFSGVTAVRFTINNGLGNLVTCAELELYQKSTGIHEELKRIFADELCTTLNAGIGEKEIKDIKSLFLKELAQKIYTGGYDKFNKTYRIQEYNPYRPVKDLQTELKTSSGYNQFENPTGIFFKPGEDIVVFVEDTHNEQIGLKVYDFYNKSLGEKRDTEVFPLSKGINVYKIQQGGLVYIDYFTLNYKTARPVKAHIASGHVNGYFEKGKTLVSDWRALIDNAEYGHFDLKGEKVNLCFPVWEEGGLRQYCKDPEKLIGIYDKYIGMEHEMMGMNKHNRTFTNHMFIRTVAGSPGAAAYADSWGVGVYNRDADGFNDETCALKKLWMITHEFGHTNQIAPDLRWVGLTEVTNNCYAVCIRHEEIPWYEKFEDETYNDGRGSSVAGGLINSFINKHMLDKDASWIISNTDPFIKLCPLWQLLSYYRYVKGDETIPGKGGKYKDWYGDVIEICRKSASGGKSNGELQVAFMKNACDVLQADLTGFFENAGMLRPCDALVEDYTSGTLKITAAQCTDVRNTASKYRKPTAMINYMSANAIRIFKAEQSVSGSFGAGISGTGNTRTISHTTWKNVVAFETYAGSQPTYVAVMGTGIASSKSLTDVQPLPLLEKASTQVYYPQGSTAIYAVAWNGVRTLVYGASNGIEKQ